MNNIKILRVEKGLTQGQLAKEVNLTQTAVSQWELGKNTPDAQSSRKLAEYFGVSLDYLLGRTNNRNTSYYASNISDSNFVQGSGSVTIEQSELLSKEESEILRIFRNLDVRGRTKLLNFAFEIEDNNRGTKNG